MMRTMAVVLAAGSLFAQPPARVQTGYDAIQTARLKADLTFLSSDALEGRASLQRGSEVAIQWIASEFAKAGLKPLAGGSYLQPVPIIEFAPDREVTSAALTRDGRTETFRAPDVVASVPREVALSGRVVFAGYGITAPELNYDDYQGIDARGKIVLLFNHEPQESDANSVFNGLGNTRYTNNTYKLFNAERHGAIAVLTMPDPSHYGPVRSVPTQTPSGRPRPKAEVLVSGGPTLPLFTLTSKAGDALLEAAGKKASAVQAAIEARLTPSPFEIPGSLELRAAPAETRRANSYNVVGLLEGSDPALKNDTILFSAHYDHEGVEPGDVFHGADDNGSGTVAVVSLAHAFAANPTRPRRSVLFVVFAAEERGLLGAYHYVSHPLRPLDLTRAVINFDMIGRNETQDSRVITPISPDTTNQLGLIGTHYSPGYRDAVESQNRIAGLDLTYKWDLDAYNGVLFRSDQYPFLMHGIPAVWWFTGFHPDYHHTSDSVEKINFEKLTKIVRLAYLAGFDFADTNHPPTLEPKAKAK